MNVFLSAIEPCLVPEGGGVNSDVDIYHLRKLDRPGEFR